ncbi:hypothetical protein EX30DRAFT_371849 [Ascodesmis nigricans]|uniref:Uncharacterized protein n=1 Tax=Ascodesmis nigricans TaxID=341454 RepID=A0A4S2MVZ8_9PEZI|nr:hypothetical protein EX30DRAFT_371849 [Ascodesmis nigricans]
MAPKGQLQTRLWNLGPTKEINNAELFAISEALRYVLQNDLKNREGDPVNMLKVLRRIQSMEPGPQATVNMAMEYKEKIFQAARKVDEDIMGIQVNDTWSRAKLHGVSLEQYHQLTAQAEDLTKQADDIKNASLLVIITLRNKKDAEDICRKGLWIYGKHHSADKLLPAGPGAFAKRVPDGVILPIGANEQQDWPVICMGEGNAATAGGNHSAKSDECPKKKAAIKAAQEKRGVPKVKTRRWNPQQLPTNRRTRKRPLKSIKTVNVYNSWIKKGPNLRSSVALGAAEA